MKIVVDIPESLLERIKEHVKSGEFSSLSSFFYYAAENQLELQESDVLIPAESTDGQHNQNRQVNEPTVHEVKTSFTASPSMKAVATTEDWQSLIRLEAYTTVHDKLEGMECMAVSGRDEMLWGQINRLLPVKFACRALANLQNLENGDPISLDTYLDKTSDGATAFASYLENLDSKYGRDRDEKLAAGFPSFQRGEREIEKSKSRYRNQYLVYLRRKTGDVSGAMAQLGLSCVSGSRDKGLYIGLTQEGAQYASLENPVIDHHRVDEVFSEAERECYYSVLAQTLPQELQAMRLLLSLVDRGTSKPKELNLAVKDEWPGDWSEAMVSTQRSGLTARLKELGLLGGEKMGIEVRYSVTPRGQDFLERYRGDMGEQS